VSADRFSNGVTERLRRAALALPETTEGTSCVNRAFKIRGKKTFLYLGEKQGQIYMMLRLSPSLAAAAALDDPRVSVGKLGWLTLRFDPDDPFDSAQLSAWITESFRTLAPKTLVRLLDG
jgi:predicted DNA-binding protein (MmcQ/YjbR family)